MPTLTYPGVYIEELPSGVHTITGVATSIAAFVGWAPQGPTASATLVQSWQDYASQFGGLDSRSLLGYAVNQFFPNGGQQAYIVRLVADGNDGTIAAGVASVEIKDANNNTFLTLEAASPGNWATNYGVTITPRSSNPQRFTLSVVYAPPGAAPQTVETFQNLTLVQNDPLYVVNVISADSSYVTFAANYSPPSATLPSSIPATPFMLNGTATPLYLQDQNGTVFMALEANNPDNWPASFAVSARAPSNATAGYFDLEVVYKPGTGVGVTPPVTVELMQNLSFNKTDQTFAPTYINSNSQFITVPASFILPVAGTPLNLGASFASYLALTNTGAVTVADNSNLQFLQLAAADPFNWPENIGVLTEANGTNFDLEVVYNPAVPLNVTLPVTLEKLTNVAPSAAGKTAINSTSHLIVVPASYLPPSTAPTLSLPLSFTATPTMLVPDLDGTVLNPNTAPFENKMLDVHGDGTHGVYLLQHVSIFNLLCVPGEAATAGSAAILSDLQAFCVKERAFLIVDSDPNAAFATLNQNGPPSSLLGDNCINSALYFPWVYAPDPLQNNRPGLFPPCGFVAGIYAATDASRGVWKAPAGIGAGLTGESGLQYPLTDLENGSLNVQAINCLRNFKVYGDVVWGARTLAGNDQAGSQWKYLSIRRFALFLEFEPVRRDPVGRVRAQRRDAVGPDPSQRRLLHAGPVPAGRLRRLDAATGVLRQMRRREQPARQRRPGNCEHPGGICAALPGGIRRDPDSADRADFLRRGDDPWRSSPPIPRAATPTRISSSA